MSSHTPVIVVHGGAGTVAPENHAAAIAGTRAAAAAGQAVLLDGGSCEDAAVAAVRVLEDDPTFNAGRGACMNRDGDFEHDAAIMRSRDLRSGAVASVSAVRDAVLLARLVMEQTPHCLVVGVGAAALARAHGVGHFGRDEVWTAKAEAAHREVLAGRASADNRADTVGAVALDRHGHLCAAASTGGVLHKLPGRVGDTPLCGAGFYAHPGLGACGTTGVGEAILTHVLAFEALRRASERPGEAATIAASLCAAASRHHNGAAVGLILVRPDGEVAIVHASEHMSWALAIGDAAPISGLSRDLSPGT
ncbi:MAG: isoaspartyl peptidase/L-asparaginase [Nannocystis sp.]|uniref:isoaspartyl peptidase/L-asparaginase family protein n=1 Tax=Nannocystis sp. TaxID=1962667 RepID=UPI0024258653|nr:isoaspartyl peptidase/L-asparaginase [Nannocystis sp.]MBK9754969.1 isoaspartyl peptidase/L-asparaginase [Nannocystis sp.]